MPLGAAPARVVVSEVFYHPASGRPQEQWFELHNAGDQAADLSGWRTTQDVQFTLPASTTLPPGGYLVVAADAAAFAAAHPETPSFLAGWTGALTDTVEVVDRSGKRVSRVKYDAQGDWGVRRLAPPQYGHRGWEWYAAHHGEGASLELINANLPLEYAQNWGDSAVAGGTPGRANSIASPHPAPFILDVRHTPAVPQPAEPVAVQARLADAGTQGLSAVLHWRVDGQDAFTQTPLFDDGAHRDGLAGDGLFGTVLPGQAQGTVVEFWVQAVTPDGGQRVYPRYDAPADSPRTANLLYQVDGERYDGRQPLYRIVMREIERAELYELGRQFPDADSDAQMNATWIATDGVAAEGGGTQVRYTVSVRNRGHGTRTSNPNNYHVKLPSDRPWRGITGVNLNTHYGYSQVLGSAIFRELGVPMPDSRAVQVRVNGTNLMAAAGGTSFGFYAANEQYNQDFVSRTWPLDPHGNSYRAIRQPVMEGTSPEADLSWHGTNFFVPDAYTNAYFKQNAFVENDYSDLIRLLGVLNLQPGYASVDDYSTEVRRVLQVEEWMRYFAINTLLQNDETCLANGAGDDFALYRGERDPRFVVLPYDLDTVMGRGLTSTPSRTGIWRMTAIPALDRLVKTPEFAPLYYRQLHELATGAFAPARMNARIDQVLAADVPAKYIERFRAFNSNQVAYVLSLIPRVLAVTNSLPTQSGYPRTTDATVDLEGTADVLATARVLVEGEPAVYTAWSGRWTRAHVALRPGLNRLGIQALDDAGRELGRTNWAVWCDTGRTTLRGGTLTNDAVWAVAEGPFEVKSTLTINPGVTLRIEPGATVYLGDKVDIVVTSGGRLLAEGRTNAPILFTRAPGSTATWGGITVNGGTGTPETRLVCVHLENNGSTAIHSTGGTVFLDRLTFGSTEHQYVSLDKSSFVVSHCHFPTPTGAFELVHGTGGVKAGGRGIFYRNFFGAPHGYNDVVDFTGGNRPGPVVHFVDNVFVGSGDDALDLDGTDAWIEGNIFLHIHKNGSPDSSSAVSGGNDSGDTSEITIVGNLIYDCDQAATAKQGNFYTLIHNTIVRQTHQGGLDTDGAVVNFTDEGTTEGAGAYLEANLLADVEQLTRGRTAAVVTFTNNLMPLTWDGPGGRNTTNAPLFNHLPDLSETYFESWEAAQVMRDWLSLLPGSPARAGGPDGLDLGGVVPLGAALSGTPVGTNRLDAARLRVGFNRQGQGIPAAGFPAGSGYTAYRWRLDNGPWSAQTPIDQPIVLSQLADGPHQVEVAGRRDTGLYQDDSEFGEDALVTRSPVWVVDRQAPAPQPAPAVRLSEIRASATGGFVELHNAGDADADLAGMGLSDNAAEPYKFVFPAGVALGAGEYLRLETGPATADSPSRLGFSLKPSGDDLSLREAPARGGGLLDSVVFGPQVEGCSLGRGPDGAWHLGRPTPGARNEALALGETRRIQINEWLTSAQFTAAGDFVELYNPQPLPVALDGLFLSDASGAPQRHPLAPLSFIAGSGFLALTADGDPGQGPTHLGFRLTPAGGLILLSDANLAAIDAVNYGPQRTDVAQGRSPNGADTWAWLAHPTPGGPNPGSLESTQVTQFALNLMEFGQVWRYQQTGNLDGVAWQDPDYNDSAWPAGPGLLAYEQNSAIVPLVGQTLADPRSAPAGLAPGHAYYFRTSLEVTGDWAGAELKATLRLDDGGILYLNGTEVLRVRMPAGSVDHTTLTASGQQPSGGDASADEVFTLPSSALLPGRNVLAAEVHQNGTNSSDITWGMALTVSRSVTNTVGDARASVVLNEVRAAANTAAPNGGAGADFIELHNPTDRAADLSGLTLSDDPAQPARFVIPPGTSVAARGYYVVACDSSQPASGTNTGFGLETAWGAVFLFNSVDQGGALLDAMYYGLQTPAHSLGRSLAGTGDWVLGTPTPGGVNAPVAMGDAASLRINEWMADPANGSDWLEVYNPSSRPVALGGLFLTDDLGAATKSPLAPLSFIGVGEHAYALFKADSGSLAGADHLAFSLSKAGEAIGLFGPATEMIDAVGFGPQAAGVSQGRYPDGGSEVISFPGSASPLASNSLGGATADSDGDGLPDAWERAYFGGLSRDGRGDFDGDGLSDTQEYLAGTDPTDPTDSVRLSAELSNGALRLRFVAVAGKSYTVQSREGWGAAGWQRLTDLAPVSNTVPVVVQDPAPLNGSRFYRLLTPRQP